MSENKGHVRHLRRVSTGDYEHIEEEVKLPISEASEAEERLQEAANIADKEAERRSRKLILPKSKETGKTHMERWH